MGKFPTGESDLKRTGFRFIFASPSFTAQIIIGFSAVFMRACARARVYERNERLSRWGERKECQFCSVI